MSDQRPGDSVLHQTEHEAVIGERLDGIDSENVAITNLTAITGGESPTEAEHNAVITKVNAILGALRSSHIIP